MPKLSPVLLLAVLAGFPLSAQAPPASPPAPGPVEAVTTPPHPCKVPGITEEVRCATYAVWENREAKQGRKIGINIVILPAKGPEKLPDPIFFFGGGPGEGIAEEAPGLATIPERKRDFVLVDQRGTGRSNTLDCEFWGHPLDLRQAAGDVFPMAAVRACKEKLEKVADLRYYTTPLGMDDVDEIRAWLGYGKINLSGGSYGTRAAEVYLQRHPESVRTVTLIAVAPLDEYLPLHHAYAGQRALDMLLAECAADAACHAAFPNSKEEIRKVMERIDQGVSVTVTNPVTHEKQEVRPSHGLVAEGIRFLMYGRQGGGALPLQIHQAFEGNLAPLVQMAIERRLEIDEALAMGMLFSVTCAEDLPFIDDATAAQLTKGTILGDYRIRQQKEVCKVWPRGEIPAGLHTPVHSDVPVLLIAGERDPVTPPEFAERAKKYLSNSLLVLVPRGSHGGAGECTDAMIRQFVDTASVKGIDTSCLQKLPPTKFATSG